MERLLQSVELTPPLTQAEVFGDLQTLVCEGKGSFRLDASQDSYFLQREPQPRRYESVLHILSDFVQKGQRSGCIPPFQKHADLEYGRDARIVGPKVGEDSEFSLFHSGIGKISSEKAAKP